MARFLTPTIALAMLFTAQLALAGGKPLLAGTNVWPGYEPLYLARALGLLDPKDVRLVELPSASEVIRAFRNGQLEMAALTLDEALVLRQSRIPIKIFLVLDVSDGADVILARPGIKDFSGLKGKKVAVESAALGAYILSRALEIHGMTLSDILPVYLDVDMHERAYMDNQVDAVITFEPVKTRLLNRGAREIFSSRRMPGEIVDVLVARDSPDSLQPDKLRALTRGWFGALEHIRTRPEESARLMAKRLKMAPEEVLVSYHGLRLATLEQNRAALAGERPSLYAVIERLRKSMVDSKLLSPETNVGLIVSGEFLPN